MEPLVATVVLLPLLAVAFTQTRPGGSDAANCQRPVRARVK